MIRKGVMRMYLTPQKIGLKRTFLYAVPTAMVATFVANWVAGASAAFVTILILMCLPILDYWESRKRKQRQVSIELTETDIAFSDYQRLQWRIPRSVLTGWHLEYEGRVLTSALLFTGGKTYELPYLDTLGPTQKDALLAALQAQLGSPKSGDARIQTRP